MNILDSIIKLGYNPDLTTNEQAKIKLLNVSVILALTNIFSFNIAHCIIDLKNTFIMVIILSLFVIPFGYVFILNSKRKYARAKMVFFISLTASIFIASGIFIGNRLGFQTYFLVFSIVPFIFYSIHERLTIIMIAIINLSAYFYVEYFLRIQLIPLDSKLFSGSVAVGYKIAVILSCYSTLAIVLIAFQFVIYKNEKDLKIALDEVVKLANYDSLTNLYNRRAFNEIMMEEVNKNLKGEYTIYLIIADIDYFKKVNDTYGHLVGDEVLKKIAGELKDNLGENDLVARWGGEEFIIMLPHTDIKRAEIVTENLRVCIEELEFINNMHITMSFGVAQYQSGEDIANTIKRADDALYRAKSCGRNRVEII